MGVFAALTSDGPALRGGRALDVGCGYGATLDLLREAGFDVEGCEMSPRAATFCRRRGFRLTRLYKGTVRAIDWMLGWGEYMMAVGYKPGSGAGAAGAAILP
jgi:SAM-dependent methyltransferase